MAKILVDFRDIKTQIAALGSRLQNIQTLTDKDRADLSNMLTNLLKQIDGIVPLIQKNDDGAVPEFFKKNLDYCEKKNATIRGDCGKVCPFGLSIPRACSSVGQSIYKMEQVDNKAEEIKDKYIKANKIIFSYCKENKQCPFADKILDDKFQKVDCDFGDNGQGQHSPNLQGSPLYPSTFQSIGLNGLYGHPLGWYGDNLAARNLFFGLFSYLGGEEYKELIKISNNIDFIIK